MYYGSGYLPAADYWRLGAIFGVIFFVAFLAIGVPWMLPYDERRLHRILVITALCALVP